MPEELKARTIAPEKIYVHHTHAAVDLRNGHDENGRLFMGVVEYVRADLCAVPESEPDPWKAIVLGFLKRNKAEIESGELNFISINMGFMFEAMDSFRRVIEEARLTPAAPESGETNVEY